MNKSLVAITLVALAISCWPNQKVFAAGPMDPQLAAEQGYEGRIRLTRFLDEPDGYCFDVPGPVGKRMKEFPLVAHTCHADPLGDQVFQYNMKGKGQIRWTYEETDLCFEALAVDGGAKIEVGAKVDLRACDDDAAQSFNYTERGEFKLNDSTLCVHVAKTGPGPRQAVGEKQDAYGRGISVNPQFTHLMRPLEMRTCGTEDPAMSRWRAIY